MAFSRCAFKSSPGAPSPRTESSERNECERYQKAGAHSLCKKSSSFCGMRCTSRDPYRNAGAARHASVNCLEMGPSGRVRRRSHREPRNRGRGLRRGERERRSKRSRSTFVSTQGARPCLASYYNHLFLYGRKRSGASRCFRLLVGLNTATASNSRQGQH